MRSRRLLSVAMALAVMAGATPASAAAPPRPRSDQWWFGSLGIAEAWKSSTGSGTIIGFPDSGVVADLPEFSKTRIRRGTDLDKPGRDAMGDPKGHGTALAALMVGTGGGSGYVGIAPDATLLPFKTQHSDIEPNQIRDLVDQGARVINMSFGSASEPAFGGCAFELQNALAYAYRKGVVILAAAGNNDGRPGSSEWIGEPAACPGVIAIGGLTKDGGLRKGKPVHGEPMALAAPSADLLLSRTGGVFRNDGATSSSSAIATASVALLRARFPKESPRQIVGRLIATAEDVHDPGWDEYSGFGAIRPAAALALPQAPASRAIRSYDQLEAWIAEESPAPTPRTVEEPTADYHVEPPPSDWVTLGLPLLGGMAAVGAILVGVVIWSRRRRT